MPLKIAIIGAGPSGCTLARLLQHSPSNKGSIKTTVFESESSPNFRTQGGSLDLHTKTGQAALKSAGLWDEFLTHARYDGEAMKLADKKLLVYVEQGQSKPGKSQTGRPEIDRPVLRRMLFEGLEEGTVVWGRKVVGVEEEEMEGREGMRVLFADGMKSDLFDLVVGADGAWSHVRPYLTDVQPFYSGIAGHTFSIPSASTTHPELAGLVNRGSLFAWSDGKSIMAQQMGDGSLNVSTWRVLPADWRQTCGYDVHDAEQVKAAVRREYADWDERLVRFTQVAGEEVVPRDLYMLPIGHRWEHRRGVTLMGDAAHLMTPFAGEGVNLAMADALNLSRAIISAASSASPAKALDENVAAFEKDMFAYASKTQQLTYDMMSANYFTPGAPRTGLERYLLRAVEDELGWWATTFLATPLVYAYFFVFKMIW